MGKTNNYIEINGKRYDANSGAQLGHAERSVRGATPTTKTPKAQSAKQTLARNIDGVRRPAPHLRAHKTAHATTLRRDVVHKPTKAPKSNLKARSHAGAITKQPAVPVAVKPSISRLDEQRLKHAKHVPQSKLITRFGSGQTPTYTAPIVQAPSQDMPQQFQLATQPAPKVHQQKPQTTADLLQHALANANSHTQPPLKHAKRFRRAKQITGLSAAAMCLVAIISFASTQSLDMVRFKMASARAGFSIGMPDYQPAGYSLGQLQYSPGVVAAHFKSNSDARNYTVIEKASNWDSQGLRDSFVILQDLRFQTVDAAGRTIYLYGSNNATWVSNGIWYQIQGNGALSTEQLITLAKSL